MIVIYRFRLKIYQLFLVFLDSIFLSKLIGKEVLKRIILIKFFVEIVSKVRVDKIMIS